MTDATGQPAPEAQHPTGPTPNPSPDATAATPAEAPDAEVATVYSSAAVSVRRSPRYWRFLVIGVFIGIIAALVLTFAFPENPDFSLTQVFGFLLLVCGVVFGAIALFVGLLIDRSMTKRMKVVSADRVDVHSAGTTGSDAETAASATADSDGSGPQHPPTAERSGRS